MSVPVGRFFELFNLGTGYESLRDQFLLTTERLRDSVQDFVQTGPIVLLLPVKNQSMVCPSSVSVNFKRALTSGGTWFGLLFSIVPSDSPTLTSALVQALPSILPVTLTYVRSWPVAVSLFETPCISLGENCPTLV